MYRLLKIDFRKYFYSKTFWVLISMYLGLLVLVFFTVEKVLNSFVTDVSADAPVPMPDFSLYSFPYIWHNLTFFGGFLKIFLALIVVIFITNEFSYRTARQNVMNGMSRYDFLWSKIIFMFNLTMVSTLLLFLSGTILGLMTPGEFTMALFFEKIEFIPAYFLELFSFCSIAFLIAFTVKKSGLSIALLAFYFYIFESIISFMLPEYISKYLPVNAMSNIIDIPNSEIMSMFGVSFSDHVSIPDAIACLVYCFVFIGIVFLIQPKRDL